MTLHHEYHLMLSSPEEGYTTEYEKKPHLSLRPTGTNKRRGLPESIWQIPKWKYQRMPNADQVALKVPKIVKEDVALYISRKDMFVSALTYENSAKQRIDCEYFFRMRLADDNDVDNVSFNCNEGILTILIPRILLKVKKIVPSFVLIRKEEVDEVRLEMPGVNNQEIECKIKSGLMSIRGIRHDVIDGVKTAVIKYIFKIKISEPTVSYVPWNIENGILTAYIPRN